MVQPMEVAVAAVPPVQDHSSEVVPHRLGHVDEVVDGLDVGYVPPVQPVVGAPALVAAVHRCHGEMPQVRVLFAP